MFPVLDLSGRGKLRYCRLVLELINKIPSSKFWEPSRLVFLTDVDLLGIPDDLGAFPSVAEPLVTVTPLAVVDEQTAAFLNPKDPAVGVRAIPEGGFFPSSPLLLPASEGECWLVVLFRDTFPFSETFPSSGFPVTGVFKGCLFRGVGTPPCAVIPRLHDPV